MDAIIPVFVDLPIQGSDIFIRAATIELKGAGRSTLIIFWVAAMDEPTRRVLDLFAQMNSDTLDLHTLFEAGGSDPEERDQVVDIVSRLVREGLLEERGSDFYALTDSGRAAIRV